MREAIAERGKSLEESYFKTRDAALVAKLRQVFERKRDKEELRKSIEITNDEVLDRLVKLSLRGEMLTAFKLYPLMEIAWANGSFDKRGSKAVIAAAVKLGIPRDSESIKRLEDWLERGPTDDERAAWRMFAAELRKTLSAKELATFREDVLKYAEAVAEAAGGVFGVPGKVSPEEKRMIEIIKKSLT
jgi:hypothetical protein